jgi:hypothetical protein
MSPDKVSAETSSAPETKGIQYKRREDFVELYANNTQLLSSIWDIHIAFGQLDQSIGPNTIVQHSAVTLSWPQAKVLLYFLQMHVTGHEVEHGRIVVTKGLIPEFPTQLPKNAEKNATIEKSWKILRKLYEEFIAANPEATP